MAPTLQENKSRVDVNPPQTKPEQTKPEQIKPEQIKSLDRIAKDAMCALSSEASFESAFAVAEAMNELRDAITPAMMKRFMALQNSPLGFRTDRDPSNTDKKTGQPYLPYPEKVVKECVIEAVLRQVQPIGNHFNIIAGRTYLTKEGYAYLLKHKVPGFAEFKPYIGIPRLQQGGAIVPCEATWTYRGRPDGLKCEIPVKVNEFMGADGIIGKTQRKMLKRVYDQVTGSESPDGEVDETPLLGSAATPLKPLFAPTRAPAPEPETAMDAKKDPRQPSPEDPGMKEQPSLDYRRALEKTLQVAGHTFNDVQQWNRQEDFIAGMDSFGSLDELPMAMARRLFDAQKGLIEALDAMKGATR